MHHTGMPAAKALEKLKEGNKNYLDAARNPGDVSKEIRKKTCDEGQFPYAIVVTCSDSRVIPEAVFSAGIGEIFTIRVAGNVMDNHQLGSVQYAAEHLGTRLVVVLGHTHCGAVGAAMGGGEPEEYVKTITDEIKKAIAGETGENAACRKNVENSVEMIRERLGYKGGDDGAVNTVGAVYDIESGEVEFLKTAVTT
ncbi:MAG: carbonic anhydrase [Lachnospiraceae bacterium]|nr:carbonic anhydrase [Ruminococcus sp.]MCM1275024.1 carbonic anhydrase [Lachnospiraceae bacterium]